MPKDFRNFGKGFAYKTNNGLSHYKDGYTEEQFDLVVARQAINYWFNWTTGEDIAKVIKKGGSLIFNTFGNKPSFDIVKKIRDCPISITSITEV